MDPPICLNCANNCANNLPLQNPNLMQDLKLMLDSVKNKLKTLEKGHWFSIFTVFVHILLFFLLCFFLSPAKSENKLQVLKKDGEGTGGCSVDPVFLDLTAGFDDEEGISRCGICQTIIKGVLDILGNDRSKAAIERALGTVCDKSFKNFFARKFCQFFVKKFTQKLVQIIGENSDPTSICKKLRLCGDNSFSYLDELFIMDMRLTDHENTVAELKQHIGDSFAAFGNDESGVSCPTCKFVITAALKELGNNTAKAAIIHAVDRACFKLPSYFKNMCEHLVETSIDKMVQLVQQDASPKAICTALGFCKEASTCDGTGCDRWRDGQTKKT